MLLYYISLILINDIISVYSILIDLLVHKKNNNELIKLIHFIVLFIKYY